MLGGVQLTPERNIFLKVVEDWSANTLIELIQRYVIPGSIIIKDGWRSYRSLNDFGYEHYWVDHSKEWVDEETEFHTNNIEGAWAGIKISLSNWEKNKNRVKG